MFGVTNVVCKSQLAVVESYRVLSAILLISRRFSTSDSKSHLPGRTLLEANFLSHRSQDNAERWNEKRRDGHDDQDDYPLGRWLLEVIV